MSFSPTSLSHLSIDFYQGTPIIFCINIQTFSFPDRNTPPHLWSGSSLILCAKHRCSYFRSGELDQPGLPLMSEKDWIVMSEDRLNGSGGALLKRSCWSTTLPKKRFCRIVCRLAIQKEFDEDSIGRIPSHWQGLLRGDSNTIKNHRGELVHRSGATMQRCNEPNMETNR